MKKINIIPNFLRNAEQIVDHLKRFYSDKFEERTADSRHTGLIPSVYSRFSTLKDTRMEHELMDLIFGDSDFDPDLADMYSFIQIQRYIPGSFICPHVDVYGGITKLHLITLTSSDIDALIIEDGVGGLVRVPDMAGQYIDFDNSLVHWVDPVVEERFTLVIGE
jgi:hypothetical protein